MNVIVGGIEVTEQVKTEPHPGFCIDMFDGSVWLTQDGKVTPNYSERGIWPTREAVQEAAKRFMPHE